MYVQNWFAFTMLSTAFFLSFYQYVVDERIMIGSGAPIIFMLLAFFLSVGGVRKADGAGSSHATVYASLRSRLRTNNLALILGVLVPPFAASVFNGLEYSILYGMLFIPALISIRVILNHIRLPTVMLAAAFAMSMSCIFVAMKLFDYSDSYSLWGRFQPYTFHPNLVGFVLVPLVGMIFWIANQMKGTLKFVILPFAAFPLFVSYEASSRGSLLAIILAALACTALYDYKRSVGTCTSPKLSRTGISFVLRSAIATLTFFYLISAYFQQFLLESEVAESLGVDNPYRGVDSGLTGRIDNWARLIDESDFSSMIFGHGFRSTELLIPYDIDNGFFVMYFDFGVILSAIIYVRFLYVAYQFLSATVSASCRAKIAFLNMCFFCISAFILNNIVARHLFGIGNPFSLLGLFFFVLSTHEIHNLHVPVSSAIKKNCKYARAEACESLGETRDVTVYRRIT